jgi:hypothetical protein
MEYMPDKIKSVLKIEAAYSSETLASTYKFTRIYEPEYQHRDLHLRKNLKSHKIKTVTTFGISLLYNDVGNGQMSGVLTCSHEYCLLLRTGHLLAV